MFEKLDKVYYDGRLVKAIVKPEGENGEEHYSVGVEFADDKLPPNEVMHEEEWEWMKSENQEDSLNRAGKFQDATDGVQARILKELDEFNPRWIETINIIQRVADRINQIKEEFINHAYGISDFMTKLTIKHITDMLEKHGQTPDLSGLEPFEVEFLELCKKHEITVDTLDRGAFLRKVNDRLQAWQTQALESYIGRPFNTWRVDDIVQVLEAKYAEDKKEVKPEAEKETLQKSEAEV